jgi:hypothetical protein
LLLSSLPIDPNFRNKDQAFNVAEHAHRELKKKRKEKEKKKKHPFFGAPWPNWKQSISRNGTEQQQIVK